MVIKTAEEKKDENSAKDVTNLNWLIYIPEL